MSRLAFKATPEEVNVFYETALAALKQLKGHIDGYLSVLSRVRDDMRPPTEWSRQHVDAVVKNIQKLVDAHKWGLQLAAPARIGEIKQLEDISDNLDRRMNLAFSYQSFDRDNPQSPDHEIVIAVFEDMKAIVDGLIPVVKANKVRDMKRVSNSARSYGMKLSPDPVEAVTEMAQYVSELGNQSVMPDRRQTRDEAYQLLQQIRILEISSLSGQPETHKARNWFEQAKAVLVNMLRQMKKTGIDDFSWSHYPQLAWMPFYRKISQHLKHAAFAIEHAPSRKSMRMKGIDIEQEVKLAGEIANLQFIRKSGAEDWVFSTWNPVNRNRLESLVQSMILRLNKRGVNAFRVSIAGKPGFNATVIIRVQNRPENQAHASKEQLFVGLQRLADDLKKVEHRFDATAIHKALRMITTVIEKYDSVVTRASRANLGLVKGRLEIAQEAIQEDDLPKYSLYVEAAWGGLEWIVTRSKSI